VHSRDIAGATVATQPVSRPPGGPIHIAPPPSDARMPPTVPVTHWPESLCRSTAAGEWTSKTFKRYCATARPRVHSPEQPSTGPAEAHMDLPAAGRGRDLTKPAAGQGGCLPLGVENPLATSFTLGATEILISPVPVGADRAASLEGTLRLLS